MATERCIATITSVMNIKADQAAIWSRIFWPSIAFNINNNGDEGSTAETNQLNVVDDEQYCVICLSQISNGEKYKHLPECRHGFHQECIDAWLQSSHSSDCPLCRHPVRCNDQQQRQHLLLHALITSGLFRFTDHVCSWFLNPLAFD